MYGDVNQNMDDIFSSQKVSIILQKVSSKWVQ
jgi:hypothetical protein